MGWQKEVLSQLGISLTSIRGQTPPGTFLSPATSSRRSPNGSGRIDWRREESGRAMASRTLPETGNRRPSDDERVPPPRCRLGGWRWWELTTAATAAPSVSSRTYGYRLIAARIGPEGLRARSMPPRAPHIRRLRPLIAVLII